MDVDIDGLRSDILGQVAAAGDPRALEEIRVTALGKKGRVTELVKQLGTLPPEQRREAGQAFNTVKREVEEALSARRLVLEQSALDTRLEAERIDVTLPARERQDGRIHPVSQAAEEIVAIFADMGFAVAEGPDVEDDWHNFEALNIPPEHPARQMFDTFYLEAEHDGRPLLLRTHTSPVQIRTMLAGKPPFRIIAPGRTYRRDSDATHTPMFHQVEGLVIDRAITLGHLKGCLIDFLRSFFGISDLPVRFRSSYFPFTEPSMEVDIGWNRKTGELGGGGDWLEILGSGMVHPKVLANCGIDPREWQGFAFGMGIERVTMLKHGIPDLRPFYESDIRWLRHYGFNPLAPAMLHEGV